MLTKKKKSQVIPSYVAIVPRTIIV